MPRGPSLDSVLGLCVNYCTFPCGPPAKLTSSSPLQMRKSRLEGREEAVQGLRLEHPHSNPCLLPLQPESHLGFFQGPTHLFGGIKRGRSGKEPGQGQPRMEAGERREEPGLCQLQSGAGTPTEGGPVHPSNPQSLPTGCSGLIPASTPAALSDILEEDRAFSLTS